MTDPKEGPPSETDFAAMENELLASVAAIRWRRKQRRHAATGIALVAVVLAVAGFTWVVLASPQLRANAAYCYERASTHASYTTVGNIPAIAEPPGANTSHQSRIAAQTAIAKCEAVWRIGAIGRGSATAPPNDGKIYPVPKLQACRSDDGVIAVFPESPGSTKINTAFCGQLGLSPTS